MQTTRTDRDWVVNPADLKDKWWLSIIALIPALLATILIFLDQQITAVIVNRKEHKLQVKIKQKIFGQWMQERIQDLVQAHPRRP